MTILWTAIIIIVMAAMIIFFEKWKQRDEKKRVAKLKKEIIILLLLISCSKEKQDCKHYLLISDKYKKGVLIKSDTLVKSFVCGVELEKVLSVKQSWFQTNCDTPEINEHWHYVIK